MNAAFIDVDGLRIKVDKVVGIYHIWPLGRAVDRLPFAQFKITVVQTPEGYYQASPNVVVRNTQTGCNEYTCGLGSSIEEAVHDAIRYFFIEVEKQSENRKSENRELDEEDFIWINHI
jgi:hypothetical protein